MLANNSSEFYIHHCQPILYAPTFYLYFPFDSLFECQKLLPITHDRPDCQNNQNIQKSTEIISCLQQKSKNINSNIQITNQKSIQLENLEETVQGGEKSESREAASRNKGQISKRDGDRLNFRTQWKNQNRNIVPNIMNQMFSYLLKKDKSGKLVDKIMKRLRHNRKWSVNKYYQYLKLIKDSTCHYMNQAILNKFFHIHQYNCDVYSLEEQFFYLRVGRIVVGHFLKEESIIIFLTSLRMSQAKRKTHLIARTALLQRFEQLSRQQSN